MLINKEENRDEPDTATGTDLVEYLVCWISGQSE
jgi:hypothetical protein